MLLFRPKTMVDSKVGLIVLLLLCVTFFIEGSAEDYDYKQCEFKVKKWASSAMDSEPKEDKHALRDLLFFLHIPRTGGRTYFYCFLKKIYSNSQECPRSYDKLRFNPRKTNCQLVSTHDDYSIMSKLPKEKTSIVTILRNPIERVFSTYEFSVEVAARFLVHPNLTSVAKLTRIARSRQNATGVSTLAIWPWKYLVPWIREDLFARRDARTLRGQPHVVGDNPYDMDDVLMPLHDYINDPLVRDIVHNGATFQISGLTNNSFSKEAHEVRHCVLKYKSLGKYVLEVAKKRLDNMLYIGFTERHKESASMFANFVGSQVISQHRKSSSPIDAEQSSLHPDTKSNADNRGNNTDQKVETVPSTSEDNTARGNLTVAKLMEIYESCVTSLRKTQAERRVNSLKQISPANFTKESRHRVPEAITQEIASLNDLDMELYNYAQNIFMKQQSHVLNRMMTSKAESAVTTSSQNTLYEDLNSVSSWRMLSFAFITSVLLLLFVFLFVNATRRTSSSKVKL